MNRITHALVLTATALCVGRVVSGCASSDDERSGPPTSAGDASSDAPSIEPTLDAGPSDDADADAGDAAKPTCSVDGWCHTKLPAPGSFDGGSPSYESGPLFQMKSVWVAPDHQAWAVTSNSSGHLLRWDGTSWRVVAVTGTPLQAIWGTSNTDLWISGDNGLVLHATVDSSQVTLTKIPIDAWQSLTKIWGTSPTDIWVAGGDSVFHLEEPAPGEPPVFVRMTLPSDYEFPQIQITALWGSTNGLWAAGSDRTWACDENGCTSYSTLVAYKWNGGNDPGSSWDRVRIPMGTPGGLPEYCTISTGASTSDGVQVLGLTIPNTGAGFVIRIASNESLLTPGLDGIQHDGAYARTIEAVTAYIAPDGIWATNRQNIWLAGPAGVRHYDGTAWQIGRIALEQGEPVLKLLHAIHAAGPPNSPDMWIVGDDVALHRVTP